MAELKQGDQGTAVGELQKLLGLKIDNYYNTFVVNAVTSYQKSANLAQTGVLDQNTADRLGFTLEKFLSTDLSLTSGLNTLRENPPTDDTGKTIKDLPIVNHFLNDDQYIHQSEPRYWIFIHHTAGGHNPYAVADMWNSDTRGRIATEYIIGGSSIGNPNVEYDGLIIRCIPNNNWAYHIGDNGNSMLHPHSVGIETCNYGPLTKTNDGFLTYVGSKVPDKMVTDLGFKFKGYNYYHSYTDKQIDSLEKLLRALPTQYPDLVLTTGLKAWLFTEDAEKAFDYHDDAYYGRVKGIFSHTSVRKDKFDMYPHPKLVQMIKSL